MIMASRGLGIVGRAWWKLGSRCAPSPSLSLFLGCFACEVALKILPLVYESEVKSRFSGNIRRRNWYEPGKTVLAPRAVTRVLQKRKKKQKKKWVIDSTRG